MNMTFGYLGSKLTKWTSLIAKLHIAEKYTKLNYSPYAYPSPELSEEEWELLYKIIGNEIKSLDELEDWFNGSIMLRPYEKGYESLLKIAINESYVAEARQQIKRNYKNRSFHIDDSIRQNPYQDCINWLYEDLYKLEQITIYETENYELHTIDRFEKCYVANPEGFSFNTEEQLKNLKSYYTNDCSHSFIIYYDARTMQPFFQEDKETGAHLLKEVSQFKLKKGTVYYKFTRTVKPDLDDTVSIGKTLVINADTFPGYFKITGETYIREQKTHTDRRYQFVINRAAISTDTNITLQADGEPTTFSMKIDVMTPPNELMMELRQFDVEEDTNNGGFRIIPQNNRYNYTPVDIDLEEEIDNPEMY